MLSRLPCGLRPLVLLTQIFKTIAVADQLVTPSYLWQILLLLLQLVVVYVAPCRLAGSVLLVAPVVFSPGEVCSQVSFPAVGCPAADPATVWKLFVLVKVFGRAQS